MGRTRKSDASAFTHYLNFRLSGDLYSHIQEQAQNASLTMADYCRRRLHGHQVIASYQGAILRDVRRMTQILQAINADPSRSSAVPSELDLALTEGRAVLRAASVSLCQKEKTHPPPPPPAPCARQDGEGGKSKRWT